MDYKSNKQIYLEAKENMTGQWGIGAGATLVLALVSGAASAIPFLGNLSFLLSGSFALGYAYFIISLSNRNNPQVEQVFKGFNDFGRSCLTYILMMIFVILWTLLLIIPGIMKSYSYVMVFYILAEDPDIQPMEALKKSEEMMQGHRMRLFYLHLRFLGWAILAIFTLFIGYFFLAPFSASAQYKFYEDLKGDTPAKDEFDGLADHLLEDY
jgi:uncharacterized membrane protein